MTMKKYGDPRECQPKTYAPGLYLTSIEAGTSLLDGTSDRFKETTLRFIAGLMLLVLLVGIGCGGAADESSDYGEDAANTSAATPAAGGDDDAEEDLTKRWGPAEQPDQNEQPLEFLYWRVDKMFDTADLDGDGRLSVDEYRGETFNFQRLDGNGDGWVSKKEVIDDHSAAMREQGLIP